MNNYICLTSSKLSKYKQIYETKFTIDIINFKGEDI